MGLALDEPKEGEEPLAVDGIKIRMGEAARSHSRGKVLDYVQRRGKQGFLITPEGGALC